MEENLKDLQKNIINLDTNQAIRLKQMARFTGNMKKIHWFKRIGQRLSVTEQKASQNYLSALGFPRSNIVNVRNWEEAAGIAESHDWNSEWWEAEEQLRAGLLSEALRVIEEDELNHALNHTTAQTAGRVVDAISAEIQSPTQTPEFNLPSFLNAAAGIAVAASYQAALVLASGVDENHAFAYKFELFENGRLPLGITGNTFSVY